MKRFVGVSDFNTVLSETREFDDMCLLVEEGLDLDISIPLSIVGSVDVDTGHREIENALSIVGINRIGANARPIFSPHDMKFDVFCRGDFFINRQPVVRFELPSIGANMMDSEMLTNMTVHAETGNLIFGQLRKAGVIGGMRKRLPGDEVVQFVVYTATRRVVVLYDTDCIRLLATGGPACYRKFEGKYYLLNGEPTDDFSWVIHEYAMPTDVMCEDDDPLLVNVDGLDYEIMPDKVVNLDAMDLQHSIVDVDQIGEGVCSYDVVSPTSVRFVGERKTSRRLLKSHRVVDYFSKVTIRDIKPYLPTTALKYHQMEYKIVKPQNFFKYTQAVCSGELHSRFNWLTADVDMHGNPTVFGSMRANNETTASPNTIIKYLNRCHQFTMFGQRLMSRTIFPLVTHVHNNVVFSNYPIQLDRQVVVIVEYGLNPRMDEIFDSCIRKGRIGSPYYILYCSRTKDAIGKIGSGTVPKLFAPLSGCRIRLMIKYLSPNYATRSDRLAAALHMREREMALLMSGRPDLFLSQKRGGVIFWSLTPTACTSDRVTRITELEPQFETENGKLKLSTILN